MHDVRGPVRMVKRKAQLPDQRRERSDGEHTAGLGQPLSLQCFPFDELHRYCGIPVVAHEVVDARDMIICQPAGARRFLPEVFHGHSAARDRVIEKLQRNRLVQQIVVRTPDHTGPAAAQQVFKRVAVEQHPAGSQHVDRLARFSFSRGLGGIVPGHVVVDHEH